MKQSNSNPWIDGYQPNPSARLRLFCFPYSGGSARIYRLWPQRLPPTIEVCRVQLPGRDRRMSEPPFTDVKLLAQATAEGLRAFFDKPFAFFGHSMGALLGFELAHCVSASFGVSPKHFFASGRPAPQAPKDPAIFDLPEEQFKQKLQELNGTPPGVLDHPELMELMLPLLRADFSLGDTYVFTERQPLSCPITVLGGLGDSTVSRAALEAWAEMTTGAFSLRMFPGDHFFLHSDEARVLEVIGRELQQLSDKV